MSLPIRDLIIQRCRELGLRRGELVQRCGYKNVSKGIRRLEQIFAGQLEPAVTLLHRPRGALRPRGASRRDAYARAQTWGSHALFERPPILRCESWCKQLHHIENRLTGRPKCLVGNVKPGRMSLVCQRQGPDPELHWEQITSSD